tara:strand:- start:275 stop:1270 length:996 start_codon:yes stop_codon:yes gene_type:complete
MKVQGLTSKSYISTWLTALFAFALLVLLGFSEFFQNTTQDKKTLDLLANPIRADIMANIKTIRIKNRMGSFMLNHQNGQWILKEPRVMPANMKTINQLLESLKNVKVDTVHQYEPINIQNFSLDNPIMILDLYSKLEESLKIKVGLINPINNSSYLTVSGKDTIFQIEMLKHGIELKNLSDFIESSIFSSPISNIQEFHLFRRELKESQNSLVLKGAQWSAKRYKKINNASVNKKLSKILNMKTHMIVDKQDEKLQNFISNYIQNPLYTIKIKTKSSKNITYNISTLIKALPELKLEKRQYFIMTASDRQYPYIITKENLSEFVIRYKDLR